MRRRGYSSSPRPARWMALKYAGKCSACARELPAGARAWYDPADRSTTCTELACARTRGLTREAWHGSPVSGRWVEQLADVPLHPGMVAETCQVRCPGEDMADRFNETHG